MFNCSVHLMKTQATDSEDAVVVTTVTVVMCLTEDVISVTTLEKIVNFHIVGLTKGEARDKHQATGSAFHDGDLYLLCQFLHTDFSVG